MCALGKSRLLLSRCGGVTYALVNGKGDPVTSLHEASRRHEKLVVFLGSDFFFAEKCGDLDEFREENGGIGTMITCVVLVVCSVKILFILEA